MKDRIDTALDAVRRPVAQATGLPNAQYTNFEPYMRERDGVLWANWAGLAVTADVPDPWDVRPVTFLGVPLLLLRDRAGLVRVF